VKPNYFLKKSMNNQSVQQLNVKTMAGKLLTVYTLFALKVTSHPVFRQVEARIGKKKTNIILALSSLLFLYLLWSIYFAGRDNHKEAKPIPVLVSKVRVGDAPVYLNTIGTVSPVDSIIIKTQINGRITDVLFKEGQLVKKGDLLVQIDPRPYEASLEQAQGQLARDQALLDNARLDLNRYIALDKEDSVSKQTLATQVSLVKQYEGTVQLDKGLVESAKVNLQYCKIISTIDGVVGLRQVNPGNFVQTSDTNPITTVNTISPISVVFSIPEDDLARVQDSSQKADLVADAYDRREVKLLETGVLSAIDSQIDDTTGTIKLRATFKNDQRKLYPFQFVNIRLKIETLLSAFMIPTAAIQIGREGPFVYVLDESSKTVSAKKVTIRSNVAEESAVAGDLKEGQVVITQGQDKLAEGVIVSPQTEDNQQAQASASGPTT
jgi:membrane fusion protein, multidrug efflux system